MGTVGIFFLCFVRDFFYIFSNPALVDHQSSSGTFKYYISMLPGGDGRGTLGSKAIACEILTQIDNIFHTVMKLLP